MDIRKKIIRFFNEFKALNSKKFEIKLILIFLLLGGMIFNIVGKFDISLELIISLVVFVLSMTLHEIAHGYVAYKFGDDTAKRQGRLTLNPIKHLDLQGLLLPLLLLLSGTKFLIGWAKPVPVNFYRLKPNRLGMFCVSIAGIVVNIILAVCSVLILKMIIKYNFHIANIGTINSNEILITSLIYMYITNLLLAVFNLIPITPLDGGRIIYSLGNKKIRKFYDEIEKYGIIIVFILVYFGVFSNIFQIILKFFLTLIVFNFEIQIM